MPQFHPSDTHFPSSQLTFQQSQEYKTSHKQLGAIIQRMVMQVELNPEVRVLIDSNESLQRTCATDGLTHFQRNI